MMERKGEETKTFNSDKSGSEDEHYKEKIVYKIIPVPYYYPVPVEPEWYNKNYERQFRPNEYSSFPFVDTTTEHFVPPPPPGFPFSRMRHPHHVMYEPPATKRATVSPPPYTTPQGTSPKKPVENGRDNDTPHVVKNIQNGIGTESCATENTNAHVDNNSTDDTSTLPNNITKPLRDIDTDEIIIKTEIDDEDGTETTVIINGTETPKVIQEDVDIHDDREVTRDRKRYLMTFPYDQKKKVKVNGHTEGHEVTKSIDDEPPKTPKPVEVHVTEPVRVETHEPPLHFPVAGFPPGHAIRYPPGVVPAVPNHQVIPQAIGGVPYVMVPMQNPAIGPAFIHPKIVHQPHFPGAELRRPDTFADPKGRIIIKENHEITRLDLDEKNQDKNSDSPNDVKYHPNGRRARTVFTRQQLLTLNNVFEKHHFVSGERMSELSDQLGLDRKIVKIWFQNKRQYSRKKGSLLEREEDYFEYQDSFNSGGAPPTMTMVSRDDINYKINDENVTYKINEDYLNDKSTDNEPMEFVKMEEKLSFEEAV